MSGGFDLQDVTKRPPVTSGDRWKEGQETGWMLQCGWETDIGTISPFRTPRRKCVPKCER